MTYKCYPFVTVESASLATGHYKLHYLIGRHKVETTALTFFSHSKRINIQPIPISYKKSQLKHYDFLIN